MVNQNLALLHATFNICSRVNFKHYAIWFWEAIGSTPSHRNFTHVKDFNSMTLPIAMCRCDIGDRSSQTQELPHNSFTLTLPMRYRCSLIAKHKGSFIMPSLHFADMPTCRYAISAISFRLCRYARIIVLRLPHASAVAQLKLYFQQTLDLSAKIKSFGNWGSGQKLPSVVRQFWRWRKHIAVSTVRIKFVIYAIMRSN